MRDVTEREVRNSLFLNYFLTSEDFYLVSFE